jgi:hypothetical protein
MTLKKGVTCGGGCCGDYKEIELALKQNSLNHTLLYPYFTLASSGKFACT